jgi:hypothetical protein
MPQNLDHELGRKLQQRLLMLEPPLAAAVALATRAHSSSARARICSGLRRLVAAAHSLVAARRVDRAAVACIV